jgi:hypothetical protein
VTGWLRSPRRRRRLAWTSALLLVVAGVAVGVVTLSDGKRLPEDKLRAAPVIQEDRDVPITPAVRRAINRTLDEFVPAAVGRHDPARAWELAGPALRAGTTRQQWLAGELPVHPFPYADRPFRGWRKVYAHRDKVAIDLLLHPRADSRFGPIAFGIDLVPRDGRWVVDSIFPAAIWNTKDERPFVTGPQDFTGKFGTKQSTYDKPKIAEARLGGVWTLVPALILACVPLFGLVFAARALLARRRRTIEPLPPLPRRAGLEQEAAR